MLIAREHVGLSQPAAAQRYTISSEKEVERAERRQRDPNPGEQLRVRGGDRTACVRGGALGARDCRSCSCWHIVIRGT